MSRATFAGFNVANSGLFVAQRQIDLTAHNISNADTVGYTRQRMVTSAIAPATGNTKALNRALTVGGGVQTLTLDQIRSTFLDRQYRTRNSETEYWNAKSTALYYVENIMYPSDETGLDTVIDSFFNSMQELSKNPTNKAVRTTVSQSAEKMIERVQGYYTQMKDLMYEQDTAMADSIIRINAITETIASLNTSIFQFELSGNNANDLRDKRNLLLDELSGFMNISYEEVGTGKFDPNGRELTTMNVKVGSEYLVNNNESRRLITTQDASNDVIQNLPQPVADQDKLHTIRFADTNDVVEITSGSLKGYMDIRDGNSKTNQGIPYFLNQLDTLVKGIVEEVNKVLRNGWTVPYEDEFGVYHDSITNVDFFDPTGLTAANFSLSQTILDSVYNIPASSEPVVKATASDDVSTGNAEVILELLKLKGRTDLPVIGGFTEFYNSFLSELGTETAHAISMNEDQTVLLESIENQRYSLSGVSLDEEMTNLIRFQHAYNAAARMITALDEALDILINRTGRVGL